MFTPVQLKPSSCGTYDLGSGITATQQEWELVQARARAYVDAEGNFLQARCQHEQPLPVYLQIRAYVLACGARQVDSLQDLQPGAVALQLKEAPGMAACKPAGLLPQDPAKAAQVERVEREFQATTGMTMADMTRLAFQRAFGIHQPPQKPARVGPFGHDEYAYLIDTLTDLSQQPHDSSDEQPPLAN
jgi:hypothetical protein